MDMKKLFIIIALLFIGTVHAQNKPSVQKTTPTQAALRNFTDSASYAIGITVATFYMQQGIKNFNTAMITKAINDATSGKKMLISPNDANHIIMESVNKVQETKAASTIKAGEKFLATNKTKQGVKTTPSGLQYEVITEGTGIKPTVRDTVVTHYRGTLIDGTEFDNSYNRGQPATFPVGGVIKGWTEALQLMPVGSKYKLYIPHNLAYGTNETGPIPGGSTLVF
jgi:FKBP-type peptidyl-prolyl cis-trans isomerase FklB